MGENNFNVFLMLVLITIIVSLGILFSTKAFSKTNTTITNTTTTPSDETNIIENNVPQNNNKTALTSAETKELENIITNELALLKTKSSISEVTDQLKLAIALNKLKTTTSQPKNEHNQLISFTSAELLTAFNNTSLSNLELKQESIRGVTSVQDAGYPEHSYSYDNGIYTYTTKASSTYKDFPEIGHKVITATKENQSYIISIKYMWGNLTDCGALCATKVYGKTYSTYDQYISNENNTIGTLENIKNQTDLTNYFNSNYENQKDNLATYTYVFNKTNDQFKLVNFYIS